MNADVWVENIPLHAKIYNAFMVVSTERERGTGSGWMGLTCACF
jgi:hypothetical protein